MRELLPAYVCVVIAVFDVDLSLRVRVFVEFVYDCDFFSVTDHVCSNGSGNGTLKK